MPSSKSTTNGPQMPAVDLEAIAEVNRKSVQAMAEMNRRMFRAMLSVQSEVLDFTQRRLAEDAAVARELAACKEPEDAVRIVQGFQARAFEDFTREAGEIMRLSAAVASKPTDDEASDADSAAD